MYSFVVAHCLIASNLSTRGNFIFQFWYKHSISIYHRGLGTNYFTGSLPPELGKLVELQKL